MTSITNEEHQSLCAALVDQQSGVATHLCNHSTTLGRAQGNAAVLDYDRTVSRQHAVIMLMNGTHYLKDLGSSNGTFLNGVKIASAMPLKPGDSIVLGAATLHFVETSDLPSLSSPDNRMIA